MATTIKELLDRSQKSRFPSYFDFVKHNGKRFWQKQFDVSDEWDAAPAGLSVPAYADKIQAWQFVSPQFYFVILLFSPSPESRLRAVVSDSPEFTAPYQVQLFGSHSSAVHTREEWNRHFHLNKRPTNLFMSPSYIGRTYSPDGRFSDNGVREGFDSKEEAMDVVERWQCKILEDHAEELKKDRRFCVYARKRRRYSL